MKNNRGKLVEWIQSGMNYNEGINLLVEFSGKSNFRNFFSGREKTLHRKLIYEICKASKVADVRTWKKFVQETAAGRNILGVSGSTTKEYPNHTLPPFLPGEENRLKVFVPIPGVHHPRQEPEHLTEDPSQDYPSVIRRIVYEYTSLFQERSKLHTVMANLPESNAATVTAKRLELFNLIKSLSKRLSILHKAKKDFDDKKIVPDEKEIFPEDADEPEEEDLSMMDEKSLKSRKKNLQNSNSRDQSMLDYQSLSHGKEKKPMPSGPKRIKLELRMKIRLQKIEAVDMALLKYVSKV